MKTENKVPAPPDRIAMDFPIALAKSIIVLRGTDEAEVSGGIIIPESSDALKMRGTIMAVGPECQSEFIDLKGVKRKLSPWDKVIFNSYANLNILHKNVSYVILSELDVYAVLPDNTPTMVETKKSRKGIKVEDD